MIYWAPFLHFYQPPIQFHAVLKKICNECYRPLLRMLLEHPQAKVTVNICGVLTEMLSDHGGGDILEDMRKLAHNKQLEFVESAKYHAILPLIPQEEIERQIKSNRETNAYFFKDLYKPSGFFPPEMCYSSQTARMINSLGYEWILISGVAHPGQWPLDFISKLPLGSSSIKILYRDDIISNKISFRNLDSVNFIRELNGLAKDKKDIYVITAMDAETFGHHIPHWEKVFLAKVYETIINLKDRDSLTQESHKVIDDYKKIFSNLKEIADIEVVTISELIDKFPHQRTKPPCPSSWSTTKEDILRKNYYPLWNDSVNSIHQLQWEHLNICCELVKKSFNLRSDNDDAKYFADIARVILDKAFFSCQFWWANKAHGKWDINLINKGLLLQEEVAFNAYKAITVSSLDTRTKKEFHYKMLASRNIAAQIRDLLVA